MKKFIKPEAHFVRNTGGLSGDRIAELPDGELETYFSSDSYLKGKKKYRIRPGFILREIAGEYTIIPVDDESLISNAMMAPNATAVFLWKAFEQPSTVQDAVVRGMMEYDVSEETLRNAVERFVKESMEYRILEEVE